MKISQLIEGPCDVATKDDIAHMSGPQYDKYALWKEDCEDELRRTPLSGKRFSANAKDFRKTIMKQDEGTTVSVSRKPTPKVVPVSAEDKAKADAQNKASDAKLIKKAPTKDVNRKRNYNDDGIQPPKGHHNTTANRWAESEETNEDWSDVKNAVKKGASAFWHGGAKFDKKGVKFSSDLRKPKAVTKKPLMQSETYDDYHGDMSKEEYDKTVNDSEMEYTVWVGGTEPNDNWLTYDEALTLYDKFKAQGHEDVQLDARIKQDIPQDIPMGIRPIPKEVTELSLPGPDAFQKTRDLKLSLRRDLKKPLIHKPINKPKSGYHSNNATGYAESKAKPDFLDLDKDGDKKEPMKKAGKTKKEVCAKEAYNPETGRDPNVDTTEWDELIAKAKKKQEKEYANSEAGKRDPAYRHYHQYKTQDEEEVFFNYGDIGGNIIVNPKSTIEDQIFELLNRYYDISAMEFDPSKIEIQEPQLKSENEFSKKVKEAADADADAIKDRDDFIKMVSARPKSSNKAIDTIKQIVADKQNMQVKFDDGKMKVDLYTASAISQIYDAVGTSTQGKLDDMLRTKEGMLRLSNFAFSKLKEGVQRMQEGKGKRIDEWIPLAMRAAGLAWKFRKPVMKYVKKHWKPLAIGAYAGSKWKDKGNPHKDTTSSNQNPADNSDYATRNKRLWNVESKEVYSKDGELITEEYTGVDGVPDRNGKMHDPNSPKGKMIINMKKKNSDPRDVNNDGKVDAKDRSPEALKKAQRGAKIGMIKDLTKKGAKKLGKSLVSVADRSGYGNPFDLKSSKYSPEDKSVEFMKKAMKQSSIEK